jgi:hypothetical protein
VSRRRATLVAATLWCLTLAVDVAAAVLFGLSDLPDTDPFSQWVLGAIALVAAQLFAGVGVVIVAHRPENPIGWIFCVAPLLAQLGALVDAWANFAAERGLPGVAWAAIAASIGWVGVALVAVFGFLLFPDGRLPSPRWRWVARGSAAAVALFVVASMTAAGPIAQPEGYENPIGIPGMREVADVMTFVFVALVVVALASLVARYRRSRGDERRQLQVVAWAVCVVLAVMALFELLDLVTGGRASGGADVVRYCVWVSVFLLIPVSVAVAILRYRLYDFDRVVSKTLVYALLSLLLGAAYAGLVLAGQAVFSSFAGGGDLAIAVSTLVVAALFLPLRARVQRLVDRRFFRRRYDAQQTLAAFGARLREQIELDGLRADLTGVVRETMQPVHLSIWLRRVQR